MKRVQLIIGIALALIALIGSPTAQAQKAGLGDKKEIRVGIIGLDTSHVTAFTNILNKSDEGVFKGIRVVAGYPGGSPDVESSHTRVKMFTESLRKKGVEICDSIEEMLPKVDAVLLESVDGRPHLAQLIPVLKAGKIVFIDKPVAGSLADCLMIYQLAAKYQVPLFSSSSLRYYPGVQEVKNNKAMGKILGCVAHGPAPTEPHHPDLFWYGVHGCEILFTLMGPGCVEVTRTHGADADVVTGKWKDGRVASFRGIRNGSAPYGALVFGSKKVMQTPPGGSYEPLLKEICKFFRTGEPPVSAEETIQIFAFMEAADESKRQNGAPVTIESVLQKAREYNKTRKLP